MSKKIQHTTHLNISNQKLFNLYREKIESIIPNLYCNIKKIEQLSYSFKENRDFDNNYKTDVHIMRKWYGKTFIPNSISKILPNSIDLTTWYDKACWSGFDDELLQEEIDDLNNELNNIDEKDLKYNQIKEELIKKKEIFDRNVNNLVCKYKITPTPNENNNIYIVQGENHFKKKKDKTELIMNMQININYDRIKQLSSIFKIDSVLESTINIIIEFVSNELKKNMDMIAKQISEKYN